MNELRLVKTYSNLSRLSLNDQTRFRLDEINKIKHYFQFEIKEREAVNKKMSKYTAALVCNKWRKKYYFFYRCYWNSCRSNKCKPYFSVFFNYRNNKETIKRNKKKEQKT